MQTRTLFLAYIRAFLFVHVARANIWSRRARRHTMRESAPLAVKRNGGCKARQKPGMAGTDAVAPALASMTTLVRLDMLTVNKLNFSAAQ